MSEPQKIIFFSDAIFLGGAEEYLKLLVPGISREKYQTRVALTQRPNTLPLADFFQKAQIEVDYVETHGHSPLSNFLVPFRYFLSQRPALVHFNLNNSFGCFFPILAAFCARVPWRLATEHLAFQLASGKRAGVGTKKLVKKIISFCLHYTIAVSQANKRLLIRDYKIDPIRIKLIRNCIEVSRFQYSEEGRKRVRAEFGIRDDQFLIGTVARFSVQKGHEYTLDAIPDIIKTCPQARFLFVGDGPQRDKCLKRVESLGLSAQVIFAGERQDITEILSALDLFLLTSIYEGLPLSVLEAMSVGVPVVATQVSGTPEAVLHERTGLLIRSADSGAVVEAVVRLVGDPGLRERMSRQGRLLTEHHFNRKFLIKQVEDFYDQLIASTREYDLVDLSPGYRPTKASIIVLSWNKKELLQECLDAVKDAVEFEGGDHEIILVDNGSTDGTQDYVRIQYPDVRLIELDKNYRFSRGNNIGVQCAKNKIVVLLNNDVIVEPGFLGPLLRGFDQPDIFAVTSQIFNYDQSKIREETGKTFGTLVFGCFHVGHSQPVEQDELRQYVPVFYAGGGSSAYDRAKFLALGGFNEIYNPGYVEDTDLSYRAWREGYRVLFSPASKVTHKHRSTNVTKLGNRKIDYLIWRNLFVFFWQNVTSVRMFINHLVKLPFRILLDLSRRRFAILKAFLGAFLKIPRILWNRFSSNRMSRLSDEETLATIDSWFLYRHKYLLKGKIHNRPKKILIVSKRLPRLGLDGSWVVVNLIKGLSAHHEITLLSFMDTDEEKPHADYLRQYCKEVKTITLHPYSDELKSSFLFSKLFAVINACLLMRKEVLNQLKKEDLDLVQCEYLHTLNFIPDLNEYPSLLTHHEVLSLAHKRNFQLAAGLYLKTKRFFKWKLMEAYERRICRKVKSVVALSSVDQNYLEAKLKLKNVRLAQTGVDTQYFVPCPTCKETPNSLIFVGYFKHPPNVEGLQYFFQEIWPGILTAVPGANITIIGRFPPPEILSYSHRDSVVFTDYVPDVRPYLQRHSVFVAPVISGAGLRGKILEAMAMGKPVVATKRCAEGYPFERGRDLMISDTPEDFVRDTVTLLQDPDRRREMGNSARLQVEEHFGLDQLTEVFERIHEDVMQ
jgi:glycosyltransferase involved in cell wall biosynthesis